MLVTILNPPDPDPVSVCEVSNLVDYLASKWDRFPASARIYNGQPSRNTDVTPSDIHGVRRLNDLEGPVYVVVYPQDPIVILLSIVAVTAIAATLFRPTPPTPALRNVQNESPNNQLSRRTNQARPKARIPDIFGTVRATPDLVALPYRVFEDHVEVEYSYLCVGRGYFDIDADSVKDGDTKISEIDGSSVEIYAPSTSPNSGSPQLTIGSAISEPLWTARRLNAVNGQELPAANANSFVGLMAFEDPNKITSTSGVDFRDLFDDGETLYIVHDGYTGAIDSAASITTSVTCTLAGEIVYDTGTPAMSAGDTITLSNALFYNSTTGEIVNLDGTYTVDSISGGDTIVLDSPSSVNGDWNLIDDFASDVTYARSVTIDTAANTQSVDLTGTYTISTVSETEIALSSPSGVNADWSDLTNYTGGATAEHSATIYTTGVQWIGPFTLDMPDLEKVYVNFVASQGLFKDDGQHQYPFDVAVEIGVTPIDANGDATGSEETFSGTVLGSSTSRGERALTVKIDPTFTGRCKVRARRTTASDIAFQGTVVDEIKWRDAYGMAPISDTDFGDVTTIHASSTATAAATALKDRKLNLIARRKISIRPAQQFEFTEDEGWVAYSTGTVTLESDGVTIDDVGGAVPIPEAVNGESIDVEFDIEGGATITSMTVGVWNADTTSWISNTESVSGEGSHSFTFTFTADKTTPYFLFSLPTASDTFKIIRMKIKNGTYYTTELYPTDRADNILRAMALDTRIGNRTAAELDMASIHGAIDSIWDDSDSEKPIEFAYTFDATQLSFEDSVQLLAETVFCEPYRQGNQLKLKADVSTESAVLLFNHRNKIPGSEKRTNTFGYRDHDGVEIEWVDPTDDALVTYFLPTDQSAVNADKIETVGVRNEVQATLHAYRAWERLQRSVRVVEFVGTQEAELLLRTDRILVADNTRSGSLEGEVVSQDGLTLTLSQEADVSSGGTIFLQLSDGSVQSISVTQGASLSEVVLAESPSVSLALDSTNFAKTTYYIALPSENRSDSFQVLEKESVSRLETRIQASTYEESVYLHDGLLLRLQADASALSDTSGHSRTVTQQGTATVASDATRGYVHVATDNTGVVQVAPLKSTEKYTIAAWIYKTSSAQGHVISSKSPNTYQYFWVTSSGYLQSIHYGIGTATGTTVVTQDEWHHVACTYDGTTMKLYLDGELDGSGAVGQRNLGQLLVSGYGGGTALVGKMDDVRYYARALSPEAVKRLYETTG